MPEPQARTLDVAIIGGGPAGVSACLQLAKTGNFRVALFESEADLGGIPGSCSGLFGLRDQRRIYTGPGYAKHLNRLARGTAADIHVNATVMRLIPGREGEFHHIQVASPEGFRLYAARAILLATGCYESPRDARLISGPRPAGIFTTGALQQLVTRHRLTPGARALIIGSEHIALSCAFTLRQVGTSIAGMVEEDDELQTSSLLSRCISGALCFPVFRGTRVHAISGVKRVEAVELITERTGERKLVHCDSLILTGRFRSYSPLIDQTEIDYDPATFGPVVDMNLMTSVPGIFAAGNILRGADMHDLCALEGRRAARCIAAHLETGGSKSSETVRIVAEAPIRHVVPQRLEPELVRSYRSTLFRPGPSVQLSRTARVCVLEAWSGSQLVWRRRYSKLIANTRILMPFDEFDWSCVDRTKGIVLKLTQ
ncbi:MAG: FAD-dependent oxidoreductase [Burkholderiales bacterium]|nr:FAD-dependent oxidoreductase [Burkholderiales bacterium]